jgi:hypothetical protein
MPKKTDVRIEVIRTASELSAERKAQRRTRANGENWFLIARRNDRGRYSYWGRNFYYEVTSRRKEEYVLRFSYESKHGNIKIEVHATGPGHAPRKEVERACRAALIPSDMPSGWSAKIVEWQSGRRFYKGVTRRDAKFVRFMLRIADIES